MSQAAAPVANTARWGHFPHDADVGVRGFGTTPAEAFEQAAQALMAVVTDAKVKLQIPAKVSCEAPDLWLRKTPKGQESLQIFAPPAPSWA